MAFKYVLKPCPFCGSTEVYVATQAVCSGNDAGKEYYDPSCRKCGASTKFYPTRLEIELGRSLSNDERLQYVVDAWNNRFMPDDNEVKRMVREHFGAVEEALYNLACVIRK